MESMDEGGAVNILSSYQCRQASQSDQKIDDGAMEQSNDYQSTSR